MLFNKNMFAKVNDKKVLHKIGKFWMTISVGILTVLGISSIAHTNVNANASTTEVIPQVQTTGNTPTDPEAALDNELNGNLKSAAQSPNNQDKADQDRINANSAENNNDNVQRSAGATNQQKQSASNAVNNAQNATNKDNASAVAQDAKNNPGNTSLANNAKHLRHLAHHATKEANDQARKNGTTPGDLAHKAHNKAQNDKAKQASNNASRYVEQDIRNIAYSEDTTGSSIMKGLTSSEVNALESKATNDLNTDNSVGDTDPSDIEADISSDVQNDLTSDSVENSANSASSAENKAGSADDVVENNINSIISNAVQHGVNPESAAKSITNSDINSLRSDASSNNSNAINHLVSNTTNNIENNNSNNNSGNNTPNRPNNNGSNVVPNIPFNPFTPINPVNPSPVIPQSSSASSNSNSIPAINSSEIASDKAIISEGSKIITFADDTTNHSNRSNNTNNENDGLIISFNHNNDKNNNHKEVTPQVSGRYLTKSNFRHGHKMVVRLTRSCNSYRSVHYNHKNYVRNLKRGTKLNVKRIVSIGKHMTRLQLANGKYITANKHFVKVVK